MITERLRRQDGIARDVVKYLAVFVVILVMILDLVAVVQVQLTVREQATTAAEKGLEAYVDAGTRRSAEEAARDYLVGHDSEYISMTLTPARSRNEASVKVIAERSAKTYVYRYLTHLPYVGDRVDNLLNPTATGETGKTNI
jgi:hypothetical protein